MVAPSLNLKFGKLEHGWLPMTITLGSQKIHIDASHTPIDPIQSLLDLANFLLEPRAGSITVKFSLEPEFCAIHAEKHDDNQSVIVTLHDHEHHIKSAHLACNAVAIQIWRVLRNLEPDVRTAYDENNWLWRFPALDMQLLAVAVDHAKAHKTCPIRAVNL